VEGRLNEGDPPPDMLDVVLAPIPVSDLGSYGFFMMNSGTT